MFNSEQDLCLEEYGAPQIDRELFLALNECDTVMGKGGKTHKKDSWRIGDRDKKVRENLEHAFDHILKANEAIDCFIEEVDIREEVSHAATRCLMALQLYLEAFEEQKEVTNEK